MKIPNAWKTDWFIGLAVTLVFLLLGVVSHDLRGIDWQAYDMGVRFTSSRPANPNVVVVAIDDAAIQQMGSWPWPRDELAKATDIISAQHPGVIGYAVPFDTRQSNYGLQQLEQLKDAITHSHARNTRQLERLINQAENGLDTDRVFANSLQHAGPVVLAMPYDLANGKSVKASANIAQHLHRFTVRVDNPPKQYNWLTRLFVSNPVPEADTIYPPIQELSRYVTAVGHLNTGLNRQEQARREPLLIQYGKDFIPSFSLMMVARYLHLTAGNIKARLGKSITIDNTPIDTDSKLRVYPYFYQGKNGHSAFKVYSILDVLNNKIPSRAFAGKAVIIGFTARQQTVRLESPIGVDMPPAIFTAHVVSSLLNGDLYHVPSWGVWVQTGVLVLMGLYLMFVLPRLRFSTGLAFSVVLALGILNAHFILMIGKSTWVPLMVPLLALIVGHLLLSIKHMLASSVGRIQNELSTANLLLGQSFHSQGQLDQAFEQVTDAQIAAFQLKSGQQRMDSVMLGSNIRQRGRLQLLVEVMQRVQRMLNEADQARYAELFAPYLQGHAGHYIYRLKNEEFPTHLQRIGEQMQRLVIELQSAYGEEPIYQVLARVFGEHFQVADQAVQPKVGKELSAQSLQSPDDLEATYREKRSQGYQGYSANLTETCEPENPFQLITKTQTAPNCTDDSQLLAEALPNLKERTDLERLYSDGGYGGPQADVALQEQKVELVQTAIRGRQSDPEKLHLADFEIKLDKESGKPLQVTCPQGQHVPAHSTSQKKGFVT
ncbi:MAG: CHASE2 domain-containing protein, partial [Gammaproteobacteria bacterium]